jgi:phosphoribosylformylglycinamidine synthase subunit PurQ / glutaminase
MAPKVLILRAPGINRDEDAAAAIELVGGQPERVHINRIVAGTVKLADYAMLIVPGGFSYGDHLGAGRLLAVDLAHQLAEQLHRFVEDRRPVLGICNGFQVLVKAGVLPGGSFQATLTDNTSGQFECRWVRLAAEPNSRNIFTRGIEQPIEVPVAHGEGRFVVRDTTTLAQLEEHCQIALRYVNEAGDPGEYPANPNGSDAAIAGVCNRYGNVLGFMPHPENAIHPHQHPRWTREPWRTTGDGVAIFRNAVRYAQSL